MKKMLKILLIALVIFIMSIPVQAGYYHRTCAQAPTYSHWRWHHWHPRLDLVPCVKFIPIDHLLP